MARGITESDVHTAADALVAGGERPTVERIRTHLGTGSPNTVTRWLDTWWQGLGRRLQVQQTRIAVPAAPDAVAALAGDLWQLALESARASAQEAVAADRAAIQEARNALQGEREAFTREAAVLRDQTESAGHAERVASIRAAELERLVNQLEGQLAEFARQREAALERATDAETVRRAVDQRLQALQDANQSERETLAKHVRATEDRAHAEVDRARQESKGLTDQIKTLQKQYAAAEKEHLQAVEQANAKAVDAQGQTEIQRARADALEEQLARLRDLPAALEATLRRSASPAKARKTVEKQATRRRGNRAKVVPTADP